MSRDDALKRELQAIRNSFRQLEKAFRRLGPALEAALGAQGKVQEAPRRKPRLSAKQRQTLKLQGKYMGTMRGLSARKRAQVKRVRAEKGFRAAIAEARRLAN